MKHLTEDVHPISDLRRRGRDLVEQAILTRRPVVIIERGRATAVIVSAAEWDAAREREELLRAVLEGERAVHEGRLVDKEEAFARIRRAAGID